MRPDLITAEADVAAGGHGLATLNPQPRRTYALVLAVGNAPGPFAHVQGVAQFDVSNEQECGRIQPETGRAGRITSQEPIVLNPSGNGQYRGLFHLDQLQDEDYYGRGVCQWQFTGAGVLLKATGAEQDTRFLAFVDARRLLAGEQVTLHYLRRDYPRAAPLAGATGSAAIDDFPATGEEDPDRYRPELRDQLFTLTLSAEEVR